jgi:hypothetical protein
LDARGTLEEDGFLLNGAIEAPDRGVRVPLRASYGGAGSRGNITLGPATLDFRPNGLQPAALGSVLAMVTSAEGAVDAAGAISFAPNTPLKGRAAVEFRELTVATAQGAVEQLNGAIRLEGLFPPRTAGAQTITARRIVAGVPLEEPSLRFRVEPTEAETVVVIERAEGRIAEGIVHVDGARFNPSAARNDLKMAIGGLSLGRLLRDYAMDGMSGTGTLSGVIPVTFSSGGLTIESGTVQADGGGILRVAWGSSRDTFMQQGESVALMVQALEDFHYSTLRITIDRPADDLLSLKVTMEGYNPAVRSGHPFRFNISLGGELEEILSVVREGGRLGTDLFRGSLGGVP